MRERPPFTLADELVSAALGLIAVVVVFAFWAAVLWIAVELAQAIGPLG